MRFPFFRNRDSVKNGILISIRRTGDGFHPGLFKNTGKQGRPRKDNRIIMNGIVWLARSGAPWRDLPERYGSWKTVYSRFRKWIDDGILDNIFRILSLEAELEELSIDASIIQAHQHSAGAKKGGLQMKSGIAVEEPAPKSMR